MSYAELIELPLFKEKKSEKVLSAIENVRQIPLDRFLYSLGIRHIGRETAEILAKRIQWPKTDITIEAGSSSHTQVSLFDATAAEKNIHGISMADIAITLQELDSDTLGSIDGIGGVVAQSLLSWISEEDNRSLLHKFENAGVIAIQPQGSHAPQVFAGKVFVITGTLPTLHREDLKTIIKERGGKVSSAISKKTDYLVAGESPGSKYAKAEELGVAILDEDAFNALLT